MTVSSTINRVPYTGDGVTTAFAFSYPFLTNADLRVYQAGVLKTLTTHYTVSGAGNPAGGPVTFVTAPAVGESVVIIRDPAITQLTDLVNNDPFPPESVEQAHDKAAMISQRLQDQVSRAVRLADTDISGASVVLPTPEASKVLAWNVTGTGIVNAGAVDNTLLAQQLLDTASATNGDALIGVKRPEAGAVARTQHAKNLDVVDVDGFTSIQAALDAMNVNPSGGLVYVPSGSGGIRTFAASLNIYKKTMLQGAGRQSSSLVYTGTGDGIKSTWPINSSTGVWNGLRDLSLTCNNAGNTGGGFVDVGGSFVDLDNVYIIGFKHQVIFDQTEVAGIHRSEFISGIAGGSGVWIVDGDDHTAGANKGFTNRITIDQSTQFNAGAGTYNLLIDGGSCHTIVGNNFNGGAIGIRAAGSWGLECTGNEFEGHTTADILLTNTRLGGTSAGPCHAPNIKGNVASSACTYNIEVADVVGGAIEANGFGQATTAAIGFSGGAANNASGLSIKANVKAVTGSGKTAAPFIVGHGRVLHRNQIEQCGMTYVSTGIGAGINTVTPQSMEFIGVGTRLRATNADWTNSEDVLVTAVTGTTFTALFASAKAADWQVVGQTPYHKLEYKTTIALAGITTAGTNTYGAGGDLLHYWRDGNKVHFSGVMVVTGNTVAMAGDLKITGLPYSAENIGINFPVKVTWWTGLTLAGGYTEVTGHVDPGENFIRLRKNGSGLSSAALPVTDKPLATCTLVFEGTYYVLDE